MCVVSMVMDHYWDKWRPTGPIGEPFVYPAQPSPPTITPAEIEEFRKLLERAREYDKKNNQPDCELEEKKQKIRDLANQLGVAIDFL